MQNCKKAMFKLQT